MVQVLINSLIAHYEEAIRQVKKKWFYYGAMEVAEEMNVSRGVCVCIQDQFYSLCESLSESDTLKMRNWIASKTPFYSAFWCDPVGRATSKRQIISLLKYRLKILKSYSDN